MNEIERAYVDRIVAGMTLGADEQVDPHDGLIHCKRCGEARQVALPALLGRPCLLPSCLCSCQQKTEQEHQREDEQRQREERIRRKRARGLQAQCLYDYTFASDNGTNPIMGKARAYVEHWDKAFTDNTGLLLFGDVGTGKSFFAGCIANALIDQDVSVLMMNFPSLLNRLTGFYGEERYAFISGLDTYDLLILDDLGVERGTEFVMEQMFQIIPSKHLSTIELGCSLTCHKLQGSEAEYVIIGFDSSSWMLLTKEWLYTAITRAKRYCVVCAESKAMSYAIGNSNIPRKQTMLKELLGNIG